MMTKPAIQLSDISAGFINIEVKPIAPTIFLIFQGKNIEFSENTFNFVYLV